MGTRAGCARHTDLTSRLRRPPRGLAAQPVDGARGRARDQQGAGGQSGHGVGEAAALTGVDRALDDRGVAALGARLCAGLGLRLGARLGLRLGLRLGAWAVAAAGGGAAGDGEGGAPGLARCAVRGRAGAVDGPRGVRADAAGTFLKFLVGGDARGAAVGGAGDLVVVAGYQLQPDGLRLEGLRGGVDGGGRRPGTGIAGDGHGDAAARLDTARADLRGRFREGARRGDAQGDPERGEDDGQGPETGGAAHGVDSFGRRLRGPSSGVGVTTTGR